MPSLFKIKLYRLLFCFCFSGFDVMGVVNHCGGFRYSLNDRIWDSFCVCFNFVGHSLYVAAIQDNFEKSNVSGWILGRQVGSVGW